MRRIVTFWFCPMRCSAFRVTWLGKSALCHATFSKFDAHARHRLRISGCQWSNSRARLGILCRCGNTRDPDMVMLGKILFYLQNKKYWTYGLHAAPRFLPCKEHPVSRWTGRDKDGLLAFGKGKGKEKKLKGFYFGRRVTQEVVKNFGCSDTINMKMVQTAGKTESGKSQSQGLVWQYEKTHNMPGGIRKLGSRSTASVWNTRGKAKPFLLLFNILMLVRRCLFADCLEYEINLNIGNSQRLRAKHGLVSICCALDYWGCFLLLHKRVGRWYQLSRWKWSRRKRDEEDIVSKPPSLQATWATSTWSCCLWGVTDILGW